MRGYHCPTCQQVRGDRSYCAPLRCLCGHHACPAFDSYIRLSDEPTPVTTTRPSTNTAWATREEDTWIDKL